MALCIVGSFDHHLFEHILNLVKIQNAFTNK